MEYRSKTDGDSLGHSALDESTDPRRRSVQSVAVVVPVFNSASTIVQQIEGLLRQSYEEAFEVVLVNNGSTDGTASLCEEYASRYDHVRFVHADDKQSAGYSRNCGTRATSTDVVLYCDSDDIVDRDWVLKMVKALHNFDMVGGFIDETQLNDPEILSWTDPRDPEHLVIAHGFLPHVIGANCGIHRHVFDAVDGWAESCPGGAAEDVELSWRVQLAGYSLGPAAGSIVHYRRKSSALALIKQYHRRGRNGAAICRVYEKRHGLRGTSSQQQSPVGGPKRAAGTAATVRRVTRSASRAFVNKRDRHRMFRMLATGTGWAREGLRFKFRGELEVDREIARLLDGATSPS